MPDRKPVTFDETVAPPSLDGVEEVVLQRPDGGARRLIGYRRPGDPAATVTPNGEPDWEVLPVIVADPDSEGVTAAVLKWLRPEQAWSR